MLYFLRLSKALIAAICLNFILVRVAIAQPSSLPKTTTWVTDGTVNALLENSGILYLGGSFSYVGPNNGTGVGLDPTNKGSIRLFPKVQGTVNAAVPDGSGGWFIGGNFTAMGDVARTNLAHLERDMSVDPNWVADANNTVYALATNGTQLYVGGSFTTINATDRSRLASVSMANGAVSTGWDPMPNSTVYSLLVQSNYLFVGGAFQEIEKVSRTNLAAFNLTGKGFPLLTFNPNPNGIVFAMRSSGNILYVGGTFTVIDGVARTRLAALDFNGKATLWNPAANSTVYALEFYRNIVYVGGSFTSMGGLARNRLAAVSSTQVTNNVLTWDPDANGTVKSLLVVSDQVIAGGSFDLVSGRTAIGVVALDPTLATVLWTLTNAGRDVNALALSGNVLLCGGNLMAGGVRRNNLAAINSDTGVATSWNPDANGTVLALASSTSNIYAGGSFTIVDSQARNRIAAIDFSGNATAWNPNANGTVYTLLLNSSTLYAGGSFTSIGGQVRNRAAALSTSLNSNNALSWDPDCNNIVEAFALTGRSLFLGGRFTLVNGLLRNRLAVVDSVTASVLPWNPNANSTVKSIVLTTNLVYVGGAFTTIGGVTRNRLAAINTNGVTTSWNPNVSGQVNDLKISGSLLYLGGSFTTVSSQARKNLAAIFISGIFQILSSWKPDANSSVEALAVNSANLHAGGNFSEFDSDGRYRPYFASFGFGAPNISVHPTSQTASVGDTVSFSVSATGAPRYQWRHNGVNLAGQTNAALSLASLTLGDAGSYYVVVSNSFGTVHSRFANLTVLTIPPSIVSPIPNKTVVAGNNVLFVVVPTGTAPLSYQWRFFGVDIPGATSRSVLLTNVQPEDAGNYSVRVSNSAGSVLSASAVLTVLEPPAIEAQPLSQTVSAGNDVLFTVTANGTSPLSYQWKFNGTNIFAATNSIFVLVNVQPSSVGNYSVAVSNSVGFVLSSIASLSVTPGILPPVITFTSGNQVSAPGSNLTLSVSVSGTLPLTYQWRFNGAPLPAGTNSSLALVNLQTSDSGLYSVVVSNQAGTATSTNLNIRVIPFTVANEPREDFPVTDGPVYATLATNGIIYLGGNFNYVRPNRQRGLLLDPSTAVPDLDFPQVSGDIKAIVDDGSGGWFIGGDFSAVGEFSIRNLAHIRPDKTVDTSWNTFLAVPATGAAWVSALARKDDTLYVGGFFSRFGAGNRFMAAAFHTRTASMLPWNPNAQGTFNSGEVKALAVVGEMVYAGGYFTNIGGVNRSYLAALDSRTGQATSWNAPANEAVYTIASACDVLVVGGLFTTISGLPRRYFAAVDLAKGVPAPWTADADNVVYTVATFGDTVYLGGVFQSVAGVARSRLAALDAERGKLLTWNPGADNKVSVLATSGVDVFAGGDFTLIGGQKRNRIGSIDAETGLATDWYPQTSGEVYAIGVSDDGIYAGGVIGLGGTARNNVAALDARTGAILSWNPNADGVVKALAYASNTIYLGGEFTKVKNIGRLKAAAVDAVSASLKSWDPQASGPTNGGPVNTLLAVGTNIIVGGGFTSIGGSNRNYLAALDLTLGDARSWNPNPNDQVYALASAGSILYVGGAFTTVAGGSRSRLAAYILSTLALRTTWIAQASNTVFALAPSSGALYAGGQFTSIGTNSRNRLAALDLNTGAVLAWNPNANNVVQALATDEKVVYAGGQFNFISNKGRNRIAAIDIITGLPTLWNPNISDSVLSISLDGTNVFAGGVLDTIGGKFRPNFAAFPPAGTPNILINPRSQQVFPNDNVQFNVVATGTGFLFYQWRFNGIPIAGQTDSFLNLNSVTVPMSGNYSVVVSNAIGAVVSADGLLTVMVPAAISTSPTNQVIDPGNTLVLSVGASGNPPPTFQWQLNGANIPGANGSTLRIYGAQPTNSGIYSVLVGNLEQVIRSQPAAITVRSDPLPFTNLFSERVIIAEESGVGSANNLNATLETGEPRHFGKRGGKSMWLDWQAPTNGIVRFSTRGSSFDTLLAVYQGTALSNLTAVASDDDRGGYLSSEVSFEVEEGEIYSIAVDGFGGAVGDIVFSWDLDSTISAIPHIVTQPFDETVSPGQTATFTVLASSQTPLSYQWYFNHCDAIPDATNAMLILPNVQEENVGAYTVRVINQRGISVESVNTFLELGPDDEAQSHDKFDDIFSTNSPGFGPLRASSRSRATFTSVSAGALGTQILNNFGATTEYGEPISCGVVGGSSRWFNLRATSDGEMLVDTIGSSIDTLLTVYNGTDLFTLAVIACDNNSAPDGVRSVVRFAATQNTDYIVSIDGVNGVQGNIKLNWGLGTAPVISQQPTSRSVVQGSNTTLVVTASGTPTPSYRWLFNGSPVANATNTNLTLSNVQPGSAGDYSVVLSNFLGSVTSSIATVTVIVPPSISIQPQSKTVRVGATTNLTVTAGGSDPLVYQWQFNGTPLNNQTNVDLIFVNVQTNQSGNYSVTISNLAGNIFSSDALLTVRGLIEATPGSVVASNGHFQFRLVNVIQSVVVEVSTNLTIWTPISTNAGVNGVVNFDEFISTLGPIRFYRAREGP